MARGVKGKGVQCVEPKTSVTFKSNFYHVQEPELQNCAEREQEMTTDKKNCRNQAKKL
jgi:hypothetical protein